MKVRILVCRETNGVGGKACPKQKERGEKAPWGFEECSCLKAGINTSGEERYHEEEGCADHGYNVHPG